MTKRKELGKLGDVLCKGSHLKAQALLHEDLLLENGLCQGQRPPGNCCHGVEKSTSQSWWKVTSDFLQSSFMPKLAVKNVK